MYKNKGFPGIFTVPLSGEPHSYSKLEGSKKTRALILLHKNEDNENNQAFLQRFLKAIPFMDEESEVDLVFLESTPNWPTIRDAFPHCMFFLFIGFTYAEIGFQFGQTTYELIRFRARYMMQVPELEKWKDNKDLKLQIWQQLKTVKNLP